MIYEFVENNYVTIVITLLLTLFILTNNNFEKKTNRLFLIMAFCTSILMIEESWEVQLSLADTPNFMRIVLSAIGYSLRPIIPCCFALIVRKHTRIKSVFICIPLILNALVAFSALFCQISFGYTENNEFVRGPLGITPFLVAGFYVILLLAETTKNWGRGGFKETLIIAAIVLLGFLSTILESIFDFHFVQTPSMAASIAFFYLFAHSYQNNKDPLTGALTRRRFFLDANKYHATLSAVVSLDLNNLKILNDQYGHQEGDKALIAVTDIVREYTGAHASLYRIGGDEFMILCYKWTEQEVCKMIDSINEDLEATKYRCAVGYAAYSEQAGFDAVCQEADRIMYENKRQMKNDMQKQETSIN